MRYLLALLALIAAPAAAQNVKVSSLPPASTLTGTEKFLCTQAGASVSCTPVQLATYLGATFQPLDGDLTAIAALTGTNTLYYRSAANTWSPVTFGPNLSFASGALTIPGLSGTNTGDQTLTGDVTSSGTGASTATTIGANKVTFGKLVAATQAAFVGATAAGNFGEVTPSGGRTLLGLGTAATANTGTSGATIPLLNGANTFGAAQIVPQLGIGGTPSYLLDITYNSTSANGFQVNGNNASGNIQNRLNNSNGGVAYYGLTGASFSGYAPINGGRAYFGSYQVDTIIFTQSSNAIRFLPNGTEQFTISAAGLLTIANAPTYASDSAAGSGGLTTGQVYKTSDGSGGFYLKIKG